MAKYYTTTLEKGSKGNEVKEWQNFLNSQGYNLSIDGDFGDDTYNATVDWQTKGGIEADGIVGEQTWGKAGYTNYSTLLDPTDVPTIDTTSFDSTDKGDELLTQKNDAQSNLAELGAFKFSGGDFSYDLNSDALYQQLKDRYIQQGKLVAADTMGQAAALTGGYGNSYAASVGNQAYQAHLQGLNDSAGDLYQMALDRYKTQYDKELGEYKTEYNRRLGEVDIASDNYYNAADAYYRDMTNKNTAAWDQYKAKESTRLAEQNWWDQYMSGYDQPAKWSGDLSEIPGIKTDDASWFDDDGKFIGAEYLGAAADGKSTYRMNGKTIQVEAGESPYTRTVNPDTAKGVFDDKPYQPNNVKGSPLTKTEYEDTVNGEYVPVYKDQNGKYWIWIETANEYQEYIS